MFINQKLLSGGVSDIVSGDPNDWLYDIKNGYAYILRYIGNDTDIIIPDYLSGYPTMYEGSVLDYEERWAY